MGTYETPRGGAQALACRDTRSRFNRPPFPQFESLPSLRFLLLVCVAVSPSVLRTSYFAPVSPIPNRQTVRMPTPRENISPLSASLRLSPPPSASPPSALQCYVRESCNFGKISCAPAKCHFFAFGCGFAARGLCVFIAHRHGTQTRLISSRSARVRARSPQVHHFRRAQE